MAEGKYRVRQVERNPDFFVMEWVEDGVAIRADPVQMTEQELRASLKRSSRSDAEIDQVVTDARELYAA
jgi:hypothetical protein